MQRKETDRPFFVPESVCIIGMMNTAGRSIALTNYALRCRFAFFALEPALEHEKFQNLADEQKNNDE
jgi:5-methylcytosine-specific restriction protein B